MEFGSERLAASLAAIDESWPGARFCVALSGGLDSTVLLHAMTALCRREGTSGLRAVHLDHGLQAESAAWADVCRAACRAAGVPLEVISLRLVPEDGASIEAAAREARYAALARNLQSGEWLLTAHHRDDQLETVLIQLLRGGGVAGLAAMPARASFGRGWHARPLLDVDRAALAAYAARLGLDWIRDPTNESRRFDRGWLRGEVLPAIRQRWPAAATTVARSAGHFAQAQRLLTELAHADAQGIVDGGRLSIAGLRRLSRDRQVNLLRWWLRERGLPAPPAVRLATGIGELLDARADAAPLLRWPEGEIRRYRDCLYALHPMAPAPAAECAAGAVAVDMGPGLGRFELVAGKAGGLRAELAAPPAIRFRAGGETLRPHPARPRKRLKDLCREAGVVPWMRGRLPLVYVGDRLAAVGDLWIDAEFAVPPGEPSLKPVWTGRPALY
ncbi:MAG: tRNA lysidine(34) synthetase TilS [Steroidobacteraceae bacterium]